MLRPSAKSSLYPDDKEKIVKNEQIRQKLASAGLAESLFGFLVGCEVDEEEVTKILLDAELTETAIAMLLRELRALKNLMEVEPLEEISEEMLFNDRRWLRTIRVATYAPRSDRTRVAEAINGINATPLKFEFSDDLMDAALLLVPPEYEGSPVPNTVRYVIVTPMRFGNLQDLHDDITAALRGAFQIWGINILKE